MQEFIDASAKHEIGSLLKHLVIILMKGEADWFVNGTGISLTQNGSLGAFISWKTREQTGMWVH